MKRKMIASSLAALALSLSGNAFAAPPPAASAATLTCGTGISVYSFDLELTSSKAGTLKVTIPASDFTTIYPGLGIANSISSCTLTPTDTADLGSNIYVFSNITITAVGVGGGGVTTGVSGYAVATLAFTSYSIQP